MAVNDNLEEIWLVNPNDVESWALDVGFDEQQQSVVSQSPVDLGLRFDVSI